MHRQIPQFLLLMSLLIGCYPEEPVAQQTDASSVLHTTLLPPTAFSVLSVDSHMIRFSWKDQSIRETGYVLEMSVDDGPFTTVLDTPAESTAVSLFGTFSKGSTYTFRVRTVRDQLRTTPSSAIVVYYDESYFFTRYNNQDGIRWDGVYQLSNGRIIQLLTGQGPGLALYGALGFFGDSLVVAGNFTQINGAPATRVAVWDGSAWRAFGMGINRAAPVLVHGTSGFFYVALNFSSISSSYVYLWNGSVFTSLSYVLLASSGTVIGAAELNGVSYFAFDAARRNDGSGTPIALTAYTGPGLGSVEQPPAPFLPTHRQTGIAGLPGEIFVAFQRFSNPDGLSADTTLMRFDGSTWSIAGIMPSGQALLSIRSWRGNLYGVREVTDLVGNHVGSSVMRWTGTDWTSILDSPDFLREIWATPDALVASTEISSPASQSTLSAWDGSSWSRLATFADGYSPRHVVARPAWRWRTIR